MSRKEEILASIRRFLQKEILPVAPGSFAVVYGGSIYKKRSLSDIDIAFVLSTNSVDIFKKAESFIKSIHEQYQLRTDEEVPYSNKLVYYPSEIKDAINLSCFKVDDTFIVPAVEKSREFLQSSAIKQRLFLNALTTPHHIIGRSKYSRKLEQIAGRQICLLGLSLAKRRNLDESIENCILVLERGVNGEYGEMYLGYKMEYSAVRSKLEKIIDSAYKSLIKEGLLTHGCDIFLRRYHNLDELFKTQDLQILSHDNVDQSLALLHKAIKVGAEFKLRTKVSAKRIDKEARVQIANETLPVKESTPEAVLEEFCGRILPYCYNFSSPNFMGFPDAGNSVSGITGAVLSELLQQNLINQSFCSPSGTFVEMAVINWLRQIVGYDDVRLDADVFNAGGIITGGGTTSNTTAMLLAREKFSKRATVNGVGGEKGSVVIPKGIGHYSIKSAQAWIGNGSEVIEVETDGFRYNLKSLEKVLNENKNRIAAIVAYVGDSRTMSIDRLEEIADIRDKVNPSIWLHADACHGFSLGFSSRLQYKIKGIERFDSISTDPHKVMNLPYTISALLLKNPQDIKTVVSLSDLIMQEPYAWGQVTPFIGSKPWMSLKLWFAMKSLGVEGFARIIESRHDIALRLQDKIRGSEDFIMINSVEINSVVFMYTGSKFTDKCQSVDELNKINKTIHSKIIESGMFHLHQFSIPDPGIFKKGELLYPLRFMSGNPLIKEGDLDAMLKYIRNIARELNID